MSITIAVVAQGMMGSGVGKRLHERGAEVRTLLSGRSAASAERARAAGMKPAADEKALLDGAAFILSILPPGEAENLARQLAPALSGLAKKPVYVDCNAVSPQTAECIGEALQGTGCIYVDAGIIGPPPGPNARTIFYASGPGAKEFERLAAYGLIIRVMDGPNGAASARRLWLVRSDWRFPVGTALAIRTLYSDTRGVWHELPVLGKDIGIGEDHCTAAPLSDPAVLARGYIQGAIATDRLMSFVGAGIHSSGGGLEWCRRLVGDPAHDTIIAEAGEVRLQPSLLGIPLRGQTQVFNHRVDIVFQLCHLSAGTDLD